MVALEKHNPAEQGPKVKAAGDDVKEVSRQQLVQQKAALVLKALMVALEKHNPAEQGPKVKAAGDDARRSASSSLPSRRPHWCTRHSWWRWRSIILQSRDRRSGCR
jgi:hypothetical protein